MTDQQLAGAASAGAEDAVEPVRARVRVQGWPGGEIVIEAESVEALAHYDPTSWNRHS